MPALTIQNGVLIGAGLLALLIGLRGLIAPAALGAGLGLRGDGANALNEIRAQYGGFFLSVAIVSGLGVFRVVSPQAALVLLAATFGGILFGRVVSLFFDGGFGALAPTIRALYVVDALGFVAALWALRGT
jgi:hypothetical protein